MFFSEQTQNYFALVRVGKLYKQQFQADYAFNGLWLPEDTFEGSEYVQ